MTEILACVDASIYAASVCDHAAWLCGHARGGAVTLFHASEPGEDFGAVDRLLAVSRARMDDHGLSDVRMRSARGPLLGALGGESADVLVLGKHGEGRPEDVRRDLGQNATAVLRTCPQPLCLVSRVYLPIHRGLVLIDADPRHRRTIETVVATAALRELELDILMMQPSDVDGSDKLAWAREALGSGRADVYPMEAAAPEEVAAQYMAEHATDLIVFSREMMFAPARVGAGPEHRPVWSWRAPIFVC